MTAEEALAVIKQACASVVGNLEVHARIQEAITTLEKRLSKPAK